MATSPHLVKFRVNNSERQTTLNLHSASESEAISVLKQQSSIPKDANVIIYSVTKK